MEPEITTQIPSAKCWPLNSSHWGEIFSKGKFTFQNVFHLSLKPLYFKVHKLQINPRFKKIREFNLIYQVKMV